MSVSDNDILKVTYEVTLDDGTIAQNVYHLEATLTSPAGNAEVITAIDAWIEDAYNELSPDTPNGTTQNLCTIQAVAFNILTDEWEVDRLIGYFTPTITYGNMGETLPNQSSPFATFNTLRPKSRGRKFVIPFGEDRQDATILTGPALGDMVDYADIILDVITLFPLNTLAAGIVRAGVNEFLEFTGATVTDVLGTQRRRRPGVGV